jgi:cobyrinic acid a,c-diamide synthase
MGLFDGRGPSSEGSSAHVAELLQLPVVLVVEASRQAGSLAALVRGFRDHQSSLRFAGVVLNAVGSERHEALLREALSSIAMPVLGAMPRHGSLELPSRHLGLLPAHELSDLEERLDAWADLAERHLEVDALWPLMEAPASAPKPSSEPPPSKGNVRVALANDAAFHFRYPEATELLEEQDLEIVPWSPLNDEPLPEHCRGVILPGGYPELHAEQLASSQRSLEGLRQASRLGLPLYAECGGLLLLGQSLLDQQGNAHDMAGVLPFQARKGSLSLGYRSAQISRNSLVLEAGETVCGHEFHRWQLECSSANAESLWQLEGWGSPLRPEGWGRAALHASWLHLHWGGCPQIPQRLAAAARRHPSA